MFPKSTLARAAVLGVLAATVTGCFGTVRPRMEFRTTGEADPRADRKVEKGFAEQVDTVLAAEDEPVAAHQHVKVMLNSLPPGVNMTDDVLSVSPESGHQIIGRFRLVPDLSFFPNYEASWKKPVCYPQRVLGIVTLGIWMLVPTSYPCNTPNGRRPTEYWLDYAKAAAVNAGGDLVVGSLLGEGADHESFGIAGFILRSGQGQQPQQLQPGTTQL